MGGRSGEGFLIESCYKDFWFFSLYSVVLVWVTSHSDSTAKPHSILSAPMYPVWLLFHGRNLCVLRNRIIWLFFLLPQHRYTKPNNSHSKTKRFSLTHVWVNFCSLFSPSTLRQCLNLRTEFRIQVWGFLHSLNQLKHIFSEPRHASHSSPIYTHKWYLQNDTEEEKKNLLQSLIYRSTWGTS